MSETSATSRKPATARRALNELVYTGIIEQIFNGVYGSGEKLPTEAKLAVQFGVSRVTVRQALQKLRRQRLIVSVQGSGTYVAGTPLGGDEDFIESIRSATYPQLVSFRSTLEAEACGLAATRRTMEQLERLKSYLGQFRDIDETSVDGIVELHRLDLCFHETLWQAAGNPALSRPLTSVAPIFSLLWLTNREALLRDLALVAKSVIDEHTAIVDAVAAGDAEAAHAAMRVHMSETRRRITARAAEMKQEVL